MFRLSSMLHWAVLFALVCFTLGIKVKNPPSKRNPEHAIVINDFAEQSIVRNRTAHVNTWEILKEVGKGAHGIALLLRDSTGQLLVWKVPQWESDCPVNSGMALDISRNVRVADAPCYVPAFDIRLVEPIEGGGVDRPPSWRIKISGRDNVLTDPHNLLDQRCDPYGDLNIPRMREYPQMKEVVMNPAHAGYLMPYFNQGDLTHFIVKSWIDGEDMNDLAKRVKGFYTRVKSTLKTMHNHYVHTDIHRHQIYVTEIESRNKAALGDWDLAKHIPDVSSNQSAKLKEKDDASLINAFQDWGNYGSVDGHGLAVCLGEGLGFYAIDKLSMYMQRRRNPAFGSIIWNWYTQQNAPVLLNEKHWLKPGPLPPQKNNGELKKIWKLNTLSEEDLAALKIEIDERQRIDAEAQVTAPRQRRARLERMK